MSNEEQPGQRSPEDQFGQFLRFLDQLDARHLHYFLQHTRSESVVVDVQVPSERWEIEFMLDGSLEIERYRSTGDIKADPALLDELLRDAK